MKNYITFFLIKKKKPGGIESHVAARSPRRLDAAAPEDRGEALQTLGFQRRASSAESPVQILQKWWIVGSNTNYSAFWGCTAINSCHVAVSEDSSSFVPKGRRLWLISTVSYLPRRQVPCSPVLPSAPRPTRLWKPHPYFINDSWGFEAAFFGPCPWTADVSGPRTESTPHSSDLSHSCDKAGSSTTRSPGNSKSTCTFKTRTSDSPRNTVLRSVNIFITAGLSSHFLPWNIFHEISQNPLSY